MDSGFALSARPGMTVRKSAARRPICPTGKSMPVRAFALSSLAGKNISVFPKSNQV
jgi:hypothetical protein